MSEVRTPFPSEPAHPDHPLHEQVYGSDEGDDAKSLDDLKKDELLDLADKNDFEVSKSATKADIIAALKDAGITPE